MSDSKRRARLEALLSALKGTRQVGLYQIEEKGGDLFLQVTRGDFFEGDDLAKHIAEMSEGAIEAKQITVRTIGQKR